MSIRPSKFQLKLLENISHPGTDMMSFKLSRKDFQQEEDLARAWAWTEMLAYPVEEEYGEPHRIFNFDTSKLLSMK